MNKNKTPLGVFTNGLIKENPVLVSLLGICPFLAVTSSLVNGLGMGAATTLVLICSNITISLLKKVIPNQVRLPCYIVVIAGFVTFVGMLFETYNPLDLYDRLGLFLPLITVNCLVLGRAEAFASKNSPLLSALDGAGMGLGFTLALSLMGAAREILGSGTLFTDTEFMLTLPILSENPAAIFIYPAGGFFTFGIIIAAVNRITRRKPREIGCEGCPSRRVCTLKGKEGEPDA